jgi:3-dehydroquinate synthase
MPHVDLTLPHHRYRIHIEPGLLSRLGELVRSVAPHKKAAVLVDANIAATLGARAKASLAAAGYDTLLHAIDAGEQHKNLDTVRQMYDVLIDAKLERKSPVIALGGGVMGDSVGFAAATYLRGVPFIQCPTTLLAMVDASVGGKVGVNVPRGKNLIGAFYQPNLVAIDIDSLDSLPPRELRCGLAECVKHGVIRDAARFNWLQRVVPAVLRGDKPTLVELVQWNVQIKANVVMADEKETGERAHLNFGHTFAHAIEATTGYGDGGYYHGEAVALGMVAATRLAIDRGLCPPTLLSQLVKLLGDIGLPTHAADLPPTPRLMEAMRLDKKVASGKLRLVLPRQLGEVVIDDTSSDEAIAAAWQTLRQPQSVTVPA